MVERRDLSILDDAYRLDLEQLQWQAKLSAGIWGLMPDLRGVLAYEFDYRERDETPKLGTVKAIGNIHPFAAGVTRVHELAVGRDYWPVIRIGTHCSTIRRRMQQNGIPWADPYPVYRVAQKVGYDDILGFCCVIPWMRGVAFSSPLDGNGTVSQRELRRWTHIAKHLASAYAAREVLGSRPVETADAVVSEDGTIEDLQDAHEMPPYLRDGLSRSIRRTAEVLSSRSKLSADCVRGTWDSFMEGGWSIVHHTDSDGKRLMLAVRSSAVGAGANRLTPREREIADRASLGLSTKEIAYDLGISASAARTHLSNALRKLGLSRTRELVMLRSRLP